MHKRAFYCFVHWTNCSIYCCNTRITPRKDGQKVTNESGAFFLEIKSFPPANERKFQTNLSNEISGCKTSLKCLKSSKIYLNFLEIVIVKSAKKLLDVKILVSKICLLCKF